MQIYEKSTANFPRNGTDRYFLVSGEKKFSGCMDQVAHLLTEKQLLDTPNWKLFVNQFRTAPDSPDKGWRGEYWGKMMRSSCYVYHYTKDPALYQTLLDATLDILSTEDEEGRISTYTKEAEFNGWDIWSRKYVLLGMQYFMEICHDEALKQRLLDSMCRQARYIMAHIGPEEEGKKKITKTSNFWLGVNSCSILEPFVRLYNLTGQQEFLTFAEYIIDIGFSDTENLWRLALDKKISVHQYPVTKAYEMISCFVGLLEYYRIKGNKQHLTAILNFADLILENEFTVVGSAGCTHELFDNSKVRQTVPRGSDPRAQETCVTVTMMQLFSQLYLFTGESRYMDALECSLYNGFMGAINTENALDLGYMAKFPAVKMIPLPFDSYSPLTPGKRGNGIGGFKLMEDDKYYSCCVAIGSYGIGLALDTVVVTGKDGIAINLYETGKVQQPLADGRTVSFTVETAYPADGKVTIRIEEDQASFVLSLRNPSWSKETAVQLNGEAVPATSGYITFDRSWKAGDTVVLNFDMRAKAYFPLPCDEPDSQDYIAIRRGPLMLAIDNRLGRSVDRPVQVALDQDGYAEVTPAKDLAPYPCLFQGRVTTPNGGAFTVTDYASTGKTWDDDSKVAVWMKTQ